MSDLKERFLDQWHKSGPVGQALILEEMLKRLTPAEVEDILEVAKKLTIQPGKIGSLR